MTKNKISPGLATAIAFTAYMAVIGFWLMFLVEPKTFWVITSGFCAFTYWVASRCEE